MDFIRCSHVKNWSGWGLWASNHQVELLALRIIRTTERKEEVSVLFSARKAYRLHVHMYKEKGGHKTPLCVFQPNATGFSTFQPLRGTVVAQRQVRPVPRKDFFNAQNGCCGEGMMAGKWICVGAWLASGRWVFCMSMLMWHFYIGFSEL